MGVINWENILIRHVLYNVVFVQFGIVCANMDIYVYLIKNKFQPNLKDE